MAHKVSIWVQRVENKHGIDLLLTIWLSEYLLMMVPTI